MSPIPVIPVIPVTDSPSDDAMATSRPSRGPVDRRASTPATRVDRAGVERARVDRAGVERAGVERRRFGNTHAGLSDDGRDLASAIDHYKLQHHRRYITYDEMLFVLKSLGYEKPPVQP